MTHSIDPFSIAKVSDLPLIAKRIADGYLQGVQSSRQRGLGIEFNQFRPYEVGDELSRIDWKLFARSDRYFVREAESESEIDVWFLLDTSRSMLQGVQGITRSLTSDVPGDNRSSTEYMNKLEYAKLMIASLAYLAENQGDQFGFIGLSSHQLSFLPKANGKRHWHKLLLTLNQTDVGEYFPPINMAKNHLLQLQRPSVIILLSDFYQQNDEIISFLSKFNRTQSEVIAFQLISKNEDSLPLEKSELGKMIKFRDIESKKETLVSARSAKLNYKKNYQIHLQNLTKQFNDLGIESVPIDIEKPIEETLSQYLNKRMKVRR